MIRSIFRKARTHAVTPSSVEDISKLPQWRLMQRRFMQNRLSVFGGRVLLVLYLIAFCADFVAPYHYDEIDGDNVLVSPTAIHITRHGLVVYPLQQTLDMETYLWVYTPNKDDPKTIRFFTHGYEYKLLGVLKTDIHLFGVKEPARIYLWGADSLGRDLFSRVVHGGQVSLTIGVVSVFIATVIGAVLGTMSGYYGGPIDNFMQRSIELIQSFPTIPLWAALTVILPQTLSVVERYLLISVILSLIGWTGLARQVRGKVMSYKDADYSAAAKVAGASDMRIILTHMLPNAFSHIIVTATLAIPGTILGETALSFLGLGMLPPAVSWGVLLRDAQQVQVVLTYPWLLIPGGAVIVTILCYSFLGDGLRDAVDPYG
jgi:peptide/nickel transport system permease protein